MADPSSPSPPTSGWIELPEGASFPPRCAGCSAATAPDRIRLRATGGVMRNLRTALVFALGFGGYALFGERLDELVPTLPVLTVVIVGAAIISRAEWLARAALGRKVELPACAACAARERLRVRQRVTLSSVRLASLGALAAFIVLVKPHWSGLAQLGAWSAWFVVLGVPELLHHARWHDWIRADRKEGRVRLRLPSLPASS